MILGNIEKHKGQGLVAFLDILGFSKEIEENWGNSNDNPLDKILELKEHMPVHSNEELDKADSETKGKRIYPCRIQTISDSIVVSFGLEDSPMYGDLLLGTISFFDTISVIWRNCLEAGFTIRGACDFGDIYWDEKEIIGPAFINVYKLEMKMAKTSRVIVSSSFNKHLKNIYTQNKTFWNDVILDVLRKDIDGFITLNPHTLYSNKNEQEEKTHVIDVIEKLRDKAKGLNREKYSPLLAALNSDKNNLKGTEFGEY
jgi:hypothetical protein